MSFEFSNTMKICNIDIFFLLFVQVSDQINIVQCCITLCHRDPKVEYTRFSFVHCSERAQGAPKEVFTSKSRNVYSRKEKYAKNTQTEVRNIRRRFFGERRMELFRDQGRQFDDKLAVRRSRRYHLFVIIVANRQRR